MNLENFEFLENTENFIHDSFFVKHKHSIDYSHYKSFSRKLLFCNV